MERIAVARHTEWPISMLGLGCHGAAAPKGKAAGASRETDTYALSRDRNRMNGFAKTLRLSLERGKEVDCVVNLLITWLYIFTERCNIEVPIEEKERVRLSLLRLQAFPKMRKARA